MQHWYKPRKNNPSLHPDPQPQLLALKFVSLDLEDRRLLPGLFKHMIWRHRQLCVPRPVKAGNCDYLLKSSEAELEIIKKNININNLTKFKRTMIPKRCCSKYSQVKGSYCLIDFFAFSAQRYGDDMVNSQKSHHFYFSIFW